MGIFLLLMASVRLWKPEPTLFHRALFTLTRLVVSTQYELIKLSFRFKLLKLIKRFSYLIHNFKHVFINSFNALRASHMLTFSKKLIFKFIFLSSPFLSPDCSHHTSRLSRQLICSMHFCWGCVIKEMEERKK